MGDNGDGTWNCPNCTFNNSAFLAECEMCAAAHPNPPKKEPSQVRRQAAQPWEKGANAKQKKKVATKMPGQLFDWKWSHYDCSSCTYHNQWKSKKCQMCGEKRPPKSALPEPTAEVAAKYSNFNQVVAEAGAAPPPAAEDALPPFDDGGGEGQPRVQTVRAPAIVGDAVTRAARQKRQQQVDKMLRGGGVEGGDFGGNAALRAQPQVVVNVAPVSIAAQRARAHAPASMAPSQPPLAPADRAAGERLMYMIGERLRSIQAAVAEMQASKALKTATRFNLDTVLQWSPQSAKASATLPPRFDAMSQLAETMSPTQMDALLQQINVELQAAEAQC
jgi:hypothetical protein